MVRFETTHAEDLAYSGNPPGTGRMVVGRFWTPGSPGMLANQAYDALPRLGGQSTNRDAGLEEEGQGFKLFFCLEGNPLTFLCSSHKSAEEPFSFRGWLLQELSTHMYGQLKNRDVTITVDREKLSLASVDSP
jgi:hypothetical protein